MLSILCFVFFERLTFFSIKSHLFMYIVQYLNYSRMDGIISVHAFIFLSYLFCVLGGFISDKFIGQYLMIIISLLVYTLGIISISISSLAKSNIFFIIGLVCVSFSAGGIKPNILSAGAGLLQKAYTAKESSSKEKTDKIASLLVTFFSRFYFVINLSSFIVLFITPSTISRAIGALANAQTLSQEQLRLMDISEYFLIFLFSFISIFISIGIFFILMAKYLVHCWFGKKKEESQINVETSVDHIPVQKYDVIKNLPIVIGWTIYDQMSSTWIDQGKRMITQIGVLSYKISIPPSQIILINSFALIVFLPFYDSAIPAFFCSARLADTHKHRMAYGLLMIGLSYLVYYGIEVYMTRNGSISILFQVPQILIITIGEVLVSVSGMAVAYNEGGTNNKSVAMGYWYLNVALGNLLVVCLSSFYKYINAQIHYQAILYLLLIFTATIYSLNNTKERSIIPQNITTEDIPLLIEDNLEEHPVALV
ncbi:hypothetical protein NEIG_01195 [Nematocida sp. ERTm5]|nr:hypothetical protein NEIG_01195 [Nematocida sp. ERTm5]